MDREKFETLKECRVFSVVGPCLTGYRILRENRKTFTLASVNGRGISTDRHHAWRVHTEPCVSCQDHERTQYPDGYMD